MNKQIPLRTVLISKGNINTKLYNLVIFVRSTFVFKFGVAQRRRREETKHKTKEERRKKERKRKE
jgi:hypothetical protein